MKRRKDMEFDNSLEYRFWRRLPTLRDPALCWNWIGAKSSSGYGELRCHHRILRAHRISWEIHFGPIPSRQFVLHKCDNKLCVNPSHLFLGTQADNLRDAVLKKRTWRKLSDFHLTFIRSNPQLSQVKLGKLCGVSPLAIARVREGTYHVGVV